jgi:hypothetical protein
MANVNFNHARTSAQIIAINRAPMSALTEDTVSGSLGSILAEGEVAIARLIAAEAKSECPDRGAIRNAGCLLLELEDLSAGGRICHDSHAVFATGIAATMRLIALRAAEPAPDLDAIEHASWLCADLADMIDDELERR